MPILFLTSQLTVYHINMVPGLGFYICLLNMGFPDGSAGKESACNAGNLDLIPGLRRFPGEGNSYPLQYSGLENSMDYPWGCKESDTTERLSLSLAWCMDT